MSSEDGLRSCADYYAYLRALLNKPAKNGIYIRQLTEQLEQTEAHLRAVKLYEKLSKIINKHQNISEVPDDARAEIQAIVHILRGYNINEQKISFWLQGHRQQSHA